MVSEISGVNSRYDIVDNFFLQFLAYSMVVVISGMNNSFDSVKISQIWKMWTEKWFVKDTWRYSKPSNVNSTFNLFKNVFWQKQNKI